ncbi:MAG: hypothetical protein K0R65_1031 [Crocinitomicaceae bacterium]|jgi:hypothetical protein|nr:hypothetical protein [Crocinitomicaceae bacterium]
MKTSPTQLAAKLIFSITCMAFFALYSCSAAEEKTKTESGNTENAAQGESPASNLPHKYGIKAAVVTFESTMEMAGMVIKGKDIVYFDDFGTLECKETYKDGKLTESFFSDGKDLYKLVHDTKTAYKVGVAYQGTEMACDWSKFDPKEKENGNAKKLPNETIAGKECEVFSQFVKDYGSTTKFAGWQHICLLTESQAKDSKTTVKATKVEEKTAVPADKFKVPPGYKLESM